MRGTDRFLVAIVSGIVLLAAVVLVIAYGMARQPAYRSEDTPEGVAHNYMLALQRQDHVRAHGYLAPDLAGYPVDPEMFARDLALSPYGPMPYYGPSPQDVTLAIQSVRVRGETASIIVRETIHYRRELFASDQRTSTFAMNLRMHNGSWRISWANRFFVDCWIEAGGCP
jgi:hypothetical protein